MRDCRSHASAGGAGRPRLVAIVGLGGLLLAGAAGCGFHLAGRTTFLPESLKVIAVVPFENRTQRPEIEQRVTEELAAELARRGRYQVVTEPRQADAVLEGAVSSYRTIPVQFTSRGRATRIEAEIRIAATLRDRATDRVLWSQAGLIFKEQYDVPETGQFFDQETLALEDMARGAAAALVTSILEGF